MLKKLSFISLIMVGLFTLAVTSCEEDPKETCGFDEICDAKEVTSCCTDDGCVYKYNGKEYAENELDQLIADLGCSTALGLKAADDDNAAIAEQLKALLERVRSEQLRK